MAHLEKAFSPMTVTLCGIVNETSDLQFENMYGPISVRLSGSITDFKLKQFVKRFSVSNSVTPDRSIDSSD